ncbi:MAG: sporulation protein YabP [Eubacterium sp.]|nr:sporulation protein YabP [Eubacterium sp.]
MQDNFEKKKHTLSAVNREEVDLTGINDVSSFNEEEINAACDLGNVLIKGSHLLVETLDLDNGILKVSGRITAIVYSDKSDAKKLFGKLFS